MLKRDLKALTPIQQQSIAQQKRVLEGDFRLMCSDGRVIGSAKKEGIPHGRSIHVKIGGEPVSKAEKRKKALAAQVRHRRNHDIRADLNREAGSIKSASEYHTRLDALSRGAA